GHYALSAGSQTGKKAGNHTSIGSSMARHNMAKTYTTQAIAQALQGRLIGDGNIMIERVSHPADVQSAGDLALAVDQRLIPLLADSHARAAVVSHDAEIEPGLVDACIVVDRPRLAMAKLTNLFAEQVAIAPGIHPSAVIEDGAQ